MRRITRARRAQRMQRAMRVTIDRNASLAIRASSSRWTFTPVTTCCRTPSRHAEVVRIVRPATAHSHFVLRAMSAPAWGRAPIAALIRPARITYFTRRGGRRLASAPTHMPRRRGAMSPRALRATERTTASGVTRRSRAVCGRHRIPPTGEAARDVAHSIAAIAACACAVTLRRTSLAATGGGSDAPHSGTRDRPRERSTIHARGLSAGGTR